MIVLPVTAFYASILAFIYLYITALVIIHRRSNQIGVGDGGDEVLQRLVRVGVGVAEREARGHVVAVCALEGGGRDDAPLSTQGPGRRRRVHAERRGHVPLRGPGGARGRRVGPQ